MSSPADSPLPSPSWKVDLLYDGDCPLCLREVNFLRRHDRGRGLVRFTDIAAPDYDPSQHGEVDYATAMGRIHGVLADGRVIQNVEVFRQVYQVLGMGWVYAPTGWPLVGPLVDGLYGVWANWRLALTGRPPLATLVAQRSQAGYGECGDRCRVDPPQPPTSNYG